LTEAVWEAAPAGVLSPAAPAATTSINRETGQVMRAFGSSKRPLLPRNG
jgi:hypothetical protein